jgi:hypothetical protein
VSVERLEGIAPVRVVDGPCVSVSTAMLGDGQSDPMAINGDDVNEMLIGSRLSFEDA